MTRIKFIFCTPESESGGKEMLKPRYSAMKQPSLIEQLQGILSEYPDNGQIIKENRGCRLRSDCTYVQADLCLNLLLKPEYSEFGMTRVIKGSFWKKLQKTIIEMLQNAEDAEASEVEIIYDERCINQEEDEKEAFRKFFKGPALCVKNNSIFEEEDWERIKKIISSGKEKNRLKVGRFGLGFKSVFHMTDHPCIMSGDRILLVDPSRPRDEVNAEMKLEDLHRYKDMDIEAFFLAFCDLPGIKDTVINQGYYNGTIFWFPLRREPSQISSKVYDEEKVLDLFASFKHDLTEVLLFPHCLECISLHINSKTSKRNLVASVKISGNKNEVQKRRGDFKKLIKGTFESNRCHDPITCVYDITISTEDQNGFVNDTKWIIVHFFMGSDCSARLEQLRNTPDLHLDPLVGVAIPVESVEEPFEGHVFCLMPLPRHGLRSTGLPVHVNGFFSMGQNRNNLKWPTDDQRDGEIKDKDILWNQALIEECFPEAYKVLFEILIDKANENRNDMQNIERLYRAVPDERKVLDKWKEIPKRLSKYFNQLKFLYSSNQNRYVSVTEAMFATFEKLPEHLAYVKDDVLEVICCLNTNYVKASRETISKLEVYLGKKIIDLTPTMLADLIKQDDEIFCTLPRTKKYSILAFLLSGNDYENCLSGLSLLPVASGEWLTYGIGNPVFVCDSAEEAGLFEDCDDCLMFQTKEIDEYIWQQFEKIAASEITQVRNIDVTALKKLLDKTLAAKLGSAHIITNKDQLDWFRNLWKFIKEKFKVHQLEDIPLIPELKEGDWVNDFKIQLHPLTKIFLKNYDLTNNICQCFRNLGVVILAEFPTWFPEDLVSSHLFHGSIDICKVLKKLWKQPLSQDQIKRFNTNTDSRLLDEFLDFMSKHTNLERHGIKLMRSLKIFNFGNFASHSSKRVSCNDQQKYVIDINLPVRLPMDFIIAIEESVPLLKVLGARKVDEEELIEMILTEMQRCSMYSKQKKSSFMQYFLENFRKYSKSQRIKDLACEIAFVRSDSDIFKAKDLFNPDIELLKVMFCGQRDIFPLKYKGFSNYYKIALKELGLKETNLVSAQNIGEAVYFIGIWSTDPRKHEKCVAKSDGVLGVLNKNPSLLQNYYKGNTLKTFLQGTRFLVCKQDKPDQFPPSLPHFKGNVCTPNEACEKNYENECLVGATMPLVNPKNSLLFQLGLNRIPPFDKIVEQLVLLKQYYNAEEKSSISSMVERIYIFLLRNIKSVDLLKIQTEGLIWTGDSFEHPSNVIIKKDRQGLLDLQPYFYNITPAFEKYAILFERVGCKSDQSVKVLVEVLTRIEEKHHEQQTTDDYERDYEIVIKVIDKLAKRRLEIQGLDVILPVQNDCKYQIKFYPASKCTIEETDTRIIHKKGIDSMIYVSRKISHESAKALGAKDKLRRYHDDISIGIPFGQTERLESRIRNLLESYPCDSSIMKELLQNADDAKATKIMFIKDYRDHSTQNIFAESCNGFQGPSLCVFNDSYFTEKDLQGIHDLGEGSKRQDPTKIGRYGVGFNSVYHLTDTPAFLSKGPEIPDDGFLVIFDPACSNLPGVDENAPGRKYKVRDLQANFPDVLSGFGCREELFKEGRGTLFRFPLRTEESCVSGKIHSKQTLDKILDEMSEEMFECLLFVKNVRCIVVANITSGKLVLEYSVSAEMPHLDRSKRSDFFHHIDKVCKKVHHERSELFSSERKEVCYQMKISDSKRKEGTFLIIQKFGFDNLAEIPESIFDTFCKENLGYIPLGGVALTKAIQKQTIPEVTSSDFSNLCHKEFKERTSKSKTFCFLPLPGNTPLPVHINGCFRLDDARRNLIKDGFGKEWNDCILKYLVVPSYVQCAFLWRDSFADKVGKLRKWGEVTDMSRQYHGIYPHMENVLDPYWEFLTCEFYRYVIYQKFDLFPVFKVTKELKTKVMKESKSKEKTEGLKTFSCKWVPVGLKEDLKSGCFNTLHQHFSFGEEEEKEKRNLESVLKDVGLKIVHTPMKVKKAIEKSKVCYKPENIKATIENIAPNEIPDHVKDALYKSGNPFCTDPDDVVAFIATGTNPEGPCFMDTKILSPYRLEILLKFLNKSKDFMKSLPNLLVLLTENSKLKTFSKENPLYCSEFSWMFQEELDKFIHHKLLHAYPTTKLKKDEYLQDLSMSLFVELIPKKFKDCLFNKICVQWEIGRDHFPSPQWIVWLWKFIHDVSKTETNDLKTFRETVDVISEWAFVPALDQGNKRLVQVDKMFLLIDIESFNKNESMKKSLLQMKPLVLDQNVFYEGNFIKMPQNHSDMLVTDQLMEKAVDIPLATRNHQTHELAFQSKARRNRNVANAVIKSIEQLVASHDRPEMLLENLVFIAKFHNQTRFDDITNESANSILMYFAENLRNSEFKEYMGCKHKLMSLPLFVTLNESCVSLDCDRQVLIVSPLTPQSGIDHFSANMNIVIVKQNYELNNLYTFLEFSCIDETQIYIDIILPNIAKLPREVWLVHIEFIKDNLLLRQIGGKLSQKQNTLVAFLKEIDFIETNTGFKRSSCFFDHTVEEFNVLCNDEEFLPERFKTDEWIPFLKELGMHHEITDKLLIRFAKRIKNKCATDISVESKSLTLIKCLVSKITSFEDETLEILANIPFILPIELDPEYSKIFPQKDHGLKLICTRDSVPSDKVELCWSTTNVLNTELVANLQRFCIEEHYYHKLGIHKEPPILHVIKHCQNITTNLSEKMQCHRSHDIILIMNQIYSFLQKNFNSRLKHLLQDSPIIHLPSENKMVTINDIVYHTTENEIIKPYLFGVPIEYGPYIDLFLGLGASRGVKCSHYIRILHEVRQKVGNCKVDPAQFEVIKQAVFCLFSSLRDKKKREFQDINLFLPNIYRLMCKSNDLVMVDNIALRERLVNTADINYFIGSQELELSQFDPYEFVTLLPEQLRPMLLTSIVKEQVSRENMEIVKNSLIVKNLSCFVSSEQFVRGICRVAKEDKRGRTEGELVYDWEADVERIIKLIGSVNIVQVSKLETYLLYKEEIIEDSHRPLDYFFEQKQDEGNFYSLDFFFCLFQENNQAKALIDMLCSPGGLAEAMVKHMNLSYREVLMVANLLREWDNPDGIAPLLEKKKYPDLSVSVNLKVMSLFQRPGSYVEEIFHPFLQPSLERFDESEYFRVALEVGDCESFDETEDFTPLYKYVRIIEMMKSDTESLSLVGIRYRVDIGENELKEVPGYMLYRIVRPENKNRSFEVHCETSRQHFSPFDEICQQTKQILLEAWELDTHDRRRVFQRLMLQWDPDEMVESKEYSPEIFQFIQQCIQRLEETGSLTDLEDFDTRPTVTSNSSFNEIYNCVKSRARAYARVYNDDDYMESLKALHIDDRGEVRDIAEARRWMKQAKRDFQAAEAMLLHPEDQKAFNWICYLCHQASEKALKAGCYNKNANAVSLQDHSLRQPASVLSSQLEQVASEMETFLGHHTRMRYPNSVNQTQIPADIFDEGDAQRAIDLARDIIKHSNDFI